MGHGETSQSPGPSLLQLGGEMASEATETSQTGTQALPRPRMWLLLETIAFLSDKWVQSLKSIIRNRFSM